MARTKELNRVLGRLVDGQRASLGDNLVAVYLQGSFALGEGDEHSDVDFLAVTRAELSDDQTASLQELHGRLFDDGSEWAKHLEGSYAPADRFRRVDPERRPFLFLDNGARELVPDPHCNSAVIRWIVREHGIALHGPDPRELVDPVSADDLRREAQVALREYAVWAPEPDDAGPMSRWKQPYLVLTFSRILATIATGQVLGKKAAAAWAEESLDERWSGLIRRALADRPDPWRRVHQRADDELVRETLAFAAYAVAFAVRP
ncbi:MAG TPA: aminoglycoside adenylyltransferase domain-containing protein [Gaiellaceae bacterium]|nr:aminoglycoside adenylyltransferase domain-containing protein [Gaiellaceae bacterium]